MGRHSFDFFFAAFFACFFVLFFFSSPCQGQPTVRQRASAREACVCAEPWQCRPVNVTHPREIFVYHRAGSETWRSYAWTNLTTVGVFGGTPDPQMVCHAHAHSARVVYLTDFPEGQLSNASARAAFVAASLQRVQNTNTDGINFDIEGDTTSRDDLTRLVQETQAVFTAWDANTQVRCAA